MDVDSCVSPLESALPAQLPGHADGTDRRTGPRVLFGAGLVVNLHFASTNVYPPPGASRCRCCPHSQPTPMPVIPGASAEGADPAPSSLTAPIPTANWPLAGPWRGGRACVCAGWVVSWVHSGSALYSRDARSLRYAAWLGSAILKRRSAGILKPPLLRNWVCWTHQPLFPSAVTVNDRLPPSSTYLLVWFGSGLSCRNWKKSLLRGSLVLLHTRQLAALLLVPFGAFFTFTVAAS
jgi:hypothetical protein